MAKTNKIIICSLLMISCIVIPAFGFHMEFPHSGKVTDAETGESLRDASVTLTISYHCPYPPEGISGTLVTEEALTDEKGNYSFPFHLYSLKPLCWTNKVFTFIKPGYFPSNNSKLNKMTYFLDFLYYKGSFHGKEFPVLDFPSSTSNSYKAAIEKMKNAELIPMGEKGVFLSTKNKKLCKIYTRQDIEMVYDEVAGDWLSLDARGKFLKLNNSKIPKWDFFSYHEMWSWPIYANRDAIYYPVDENPMIFGMQYKSGEVKYIKSEHGDISALTGFVWHFFTIENNQSKLCHYGELMPAEKGYGFLKCLSWEDLPKSKDGDSLLGAKFKFLAPIPVLQGVTPIEDGVLFIVATQTTWHFYTYVGGAIRELPISFPSDREITAFATTTGINGLYIAFRSDGIRKYTFKENAIVEDESFRKNSFSILNGDVKSLAVGQTRNNAALYAVTGDNLIYRFSIEGFPDYLVKMKDQN
jgi:hypothetical protein